ncbi:hypothetical protein ABH935_007713 [Catenulispora sp. GAS73]|uniref:hypothetical protein n=1 Tax=Catenulispora sp. GAS73 TaxID=3156269 RepID=UPI0035144307
MAADLACNPESGRCDTILVVIARAEDVDWSGVFHAEGPASDTPRHLHALLGCTDSASSDNDARVFVDGYSHLWSTTLRRDRRAWPATAPTALLVTELLDDPRLGPDDPSGGRALAFPIASPRR